MNDLAEKALHGLDVARKQVRDRPMLSVGVLGFAVSSAVVLSGGRVGAALATRPLTTWLTIQEAGTVTIGSRGPGALMLASVVALVLLWLGVVELVRRTGQPARRVWWVAGAWALPFVVGPPLTDTTVYSYVAFGRLQRTGHDPYAAGPQRLGDSPIVAAIDPGARGVPSSAGPLGSLLQHLVITTSGGGLLTAVIVWRALGVLAAIWACRLVVELAGTHGTQALSLCALNPLVLLYVVSSPHLEGIMIAVLLASLAAAAQRRWLVAVALACVAGSISAQALVAVPIIMVVHAARRPRAVAWRVAARDLGVAVLVLLAARLVQPDGLGWLRTVRRQFGQHTPYSAAGAIQKLLTPIVRGASFDDLSVGGRVTAAAAAAAVVGYLIVTARHRPLGLGAGYALLALALLAPVLDPWFLVWGLLGLVPAAAALPPTGPLRVWVLALSVAGCLLSPPGFSPTVSAVLTGAGLAVVGAVVAVVLYRDAREAAPLGAGGRDLSAAG